jgi:mRNA-degrading endonuclease RelE of RelBE toxin-antitoxin system
LSGSGNADADPEAAASTYTFEFLPEVQADANRLDEGLRRAVADIVVGLHDNPWQGELMDDRWPHNLEGCRKIRFDNSGWKGKPRYRLVYRNEPSDGAVGSMLVLAIERRDNMIAYAQASARLAKREAARRSPGSKTP